MSEYIEREKVLDAVVAWAETCPATAISEIECMPAADVAPVVHGEWIDAKVNGMYLYPFGQKMCNVCGQIMPSRWETMPPFCYGCGALMDGGEKHE